MLVLSLGAALGLAACGQRGGSTSGQSGADKYAGLDQQVLAWRTDIQSRHPLCQDKTPGKACERFEVACKGERTITPADQARGVTAKVVAAMTFNGWDPKSSDTKPGSSFAEFTKTAGTWTRSEAKPVNLSTCAGA